MTSTTVPTSKQVYIPETLIKKLKTDEKAAIVEAQKKTELLKQQKANRQEIFRRADNYVKEYQQQEANELRLKRQAKQNGDYYAPAEPSLIFVIRIKGTQQDYHPKVRKTLTLFRLLQINNGVFVRLNKATASMLKIIEPYITYGPPNLKSVRELIYKRGYAKINGQRLPLSDNQLISKNLGEHGIICMEDIIHEIFTVGPHFKTVNSFLWPFKLSNPNGGWRKQKSKHFVENGEAGNRDHYINELIQAMN
ncbi:unnamed protein product [Cunninghamella blakesleeana]